VALETLWSVLGHKDETSPAFSGLALGFERFLFFLVFLGAKTVSSWFALDEDLLRRLHPFPPLHRFFPFFFNYVFIWNPLSFTTAHPVPAHFFFTVRWEGEPTHPQPCPPLHPWIPARQLSRWPPVRAWAPTSPFVVRRNRFAACVMYVTSAACFSGRPLMMAPLFRRRLTSGPVLNSSEFHCRCPLCSLSEKTDTPPLAKGKLTCCSLFKSRVPASLGFPLPTPNVIRAAAFPVASCFPRPSPSRFCL